MIHVLNNKQLTPFLRRHMQMATTDRDLRLDEFLSLVLEKANEFVPSQSGMILLDDPSSKTARYRSRNTLAAVACFGKNALTVLGHRQKADRGIVGEVYVTGEPHVGDSGLHEIHAKTGLLARSPRRQYSASHLCVPIAIRESVVGVLELSKKKNGRPYVAKDLELLMIFADYISASIQNFLDAKRNSDMARRDALTGLSNDRQLHALLKKEVARTWRARHDLGMMFLDLDRFKEVNDQHGHLIGSQVLAEVAYVLKANVDWPRAEIARYGGDEYVVVLPGANLAETEKRAEGLRLAIERTVFLSKATLADDFEGLEHLRSARKIFGPFPVLNIADRITASIGVAALAVHVRSPDASRLLKSADEAMYEAKRQGGNRVVTAATELSR